MYNKCNYHHTGTCESVRSRKCNRIGHMAENCRVNVPSKEGNANPPQQNVGCTATVLSAILQGIFARTAQNSNPEEIMLVVGHS